MRVSNAGSFRLWRDAPFLSQSLKGEWIGLEDLGDGSWNIIYYEILIGRYDAKTRKITGAQKNSQRLGSDRRFRASVLRTSLRDPGPRSGTQ